MSLSHDLWLEILPHLGEKQVKNIICLSTLSFSKLITFYASKVNYWKKMLQYSRTHHKVNDFAEKDSPEADKFERIAIGFGGMVGKTARAVDELGYHIQASNNSIVVNSFGYVSVSSSVRFTIPDKMRLRVLNIYNECWCLNNTKMLESGSHNALDIELINISGTKKQIKAGREIAKLILEKTNSCPSQIILEASTVLLNGQIVDGKLQIPPKSFVEVQFKPFIQGSIVPQLANNQFGILSGEISSVVFPGVFLASKTFQKSPNPNLIARVFNKENEPAFIGTVCASWNIYTYQDFEVESV